MPEETMKLWEEAVVVAEAAKTALEFFSGGNTFSTRNITETASADTEMVLEKRRNGFFNRNSITLNENRGALYLRSSHHQLGRFEHFSPVNGRSVFNAWIDRARNVLKSIKRVEVRGDVIGENVSSLFVNRFRVAGRRFCVLPCSKIHMTFSI